MGANTVTKSTRKGLFSRLRRSKKDPTLDVVKETTKEEEVEKPQEAALPTPPDTPEAAQDYKPSRAGFVPVTSKRSNLPMRSRVTLEKPPSARESAFYGPPRYDWIDIETAAAIKVQAAYRRNKVMSDLRAQGVSTAAMRNRDRRRARRGETSSVFACCGVGLSLFSHEEDEVQIAMRQKQAYLEQRKQKQEYENSLISKFRKSSLQSRTQDGNVEEVVEVVEQDEEEDSETEDTKSSK